MTAVLAYFLASLVIAVVLYPVVAALLAASGSVRDNYRGRSALYGSGLLFVLVWLAMQSLIGVIGGDPWLRNEASLTVLVLGVGLFGLLDDLLGDRGALGFRGHFSELARGRLTTGALKAFGTVLLAIPVAVRFSTGAPDTVLNVLLIALSVNAFNLLDLRPGRALKMFFIVGALALVFAGPGSRAEVAIFFGISAALLIPDLREKSMLGDIGSNVLGAVIGFEIMINFVLAGRLLALLVLIGLQAYAEFRSLSTFILRVPVLSWLDRLGRRAE